MDNELSKIIKRKVDAQMRISTADQSSSTYEAPTGEVIFLDPSVYTAKIMPGENITENDSGGVRIFNAKTVVKNQKTNTEMKFWVGTELEFLSLPSIDPNTIYFRSMT